MWACGILLLLHKIESKILEEVFCAKEKILLLFKAHGFSHEEFTHYKIAVTLPNSQQGFRIWFMPKRGASHFQGLVFTLNIEKIPCKYHSFDVAHSEAAITLYITQLKILEYGFVPEQAALWFRSFFHLQVNRKEKSVQPAGYPNNPIQKEKT